MNGSTSGNRARPSRLLVPAALSFEPLMNRFRIQIIAAMVVLLTGLPALAAAQTGSIAGQVVDQTTQRPIAAAAVSFAAGQEVVTDERGAFRLLNVPAGKQTLRVKHVGYGERS